METSRDAFVDSGWMPEPIGLGWTVARKIVMANVATCVTSRTLQSNHSKRFTMKAAPKPRLPRAILTDIHGVAKMLDVEISSIIRKNHLGLMPAPLNIDGQDRWRKDEIKHWANDGCPNRETWERRQYRR